jgi:hypothetical protein
MPQPGETPGQQIFPTQAPQARLGSPSAGADARVLAAAALLTFTSGMLLLVGYQLLGGIGVFLAIIGAIFVLVVWHNAHEGFFPRTLTGGKVAGLAASSAALGLFSWLLS